jgi:hypothetical protein
MVEGSTILVDRDGEEMQITVREPEPDAVGAAAGGSADDATSES